jgi:uncharacterized membrane protein YecN with MAPEG domain
MATLQSPPLLITGTWLVPFALYLVNLSFRTSLTRASSSQFLGDRSIPLSPKDSTNWNTRPDVDPIYTMVRAHGNFIENVPMAFVLAAVAEMNGGSSRVLNSMLAAFLVARIAHAEGRVGKDAKTAGAARSVGVFGTLSVLSGLAVYNGILVWSYWG